MEDLIGRNFKRNKYGLSLWTDTIRDVSFQFQLVEPVLIKRNGIQDYIKNHMTNSHKGYKIKVKINRIYDLDEIIVYPRGTNNFTK